MAEVFTHTFTIRRMLPVVSASSRRTARTIASLICVGLAIRAAVLFVDYILGLRGTLRFHVETATLIFVAWGLMFRLTHTNVEVIDAAQEKLAEDERSNWKRLR